MNFLKRFSLQVTPFIVCFHRIVQVICVCVVILSSYLNMIQIQFYLLVLVVTTFVFSVFRAAVRAVKAHSHQARLRPSTSVDARRATDVDGRRRAWCEWAFSLVRPVPHFFLFAVLYGLL